jgi:hypothetical protein
MYSSDFIATRIRDRWQRNPDAIPATGYRILFSPVHLGELLGPTAQWVWGLKRPGLEANYSPPLELRLKCVELNFYFRHTSSWRGVSLSPRAILTFQLYQLYFALLWLIKGSCRYRRLYTAGWFKRRGRGSRDTDRPRLYLEGLRKFTNFGVDSRSQYQGVNSGPYDYETEMFTVSVHF